MAELGAFFGNPNIQRQGARARALAEKRDVNTLPDPLTYAVMQGLLGTRPDEMGFSVLNPNYEKIKKVAEPAFALGLLGQAAPALAPLTKGLPVGASIKNVGKFDVVKRDASDIFGEGAQRIRYTDPKSNGSIEVLARQDGTASVLSLEVPEKFRGKKIGENLQKQVLEDFPDMQGQVSSKAAATTAYRIGRRPVDMPDATLKDVHKMIDDDSSVNMISPQMQERINPSASYPQQEALDTAQRNAALPIEEGGLGLPKDNTPEMRAEALGFDLNEKLYHGTEGDFVAFQKSPRMNTYATEDPEIADIYAMSERRANNAGPNIIPLVARGNKLKVSDYEQADAGNFNGGFFLNNVATALGIPWQRNIVKRLPEYGYDRLEVTDMADLGGIQTQHMFPEPEVLRSRFAAFDPKRRSEADILAGLLPLSLLDEEKLKEIQSLLE